MSTQKLKVEIELTVDELRRIQRWYRAYSAETDTNVTAHDVVLEMKLRAAYNDTIDRVDAETIARRTNATAKRYIGPERRMSRPCTRMIRTAHGVTITR